MRGAGRDGRGNVIGLREMRGGEEAGRGGTERGQMGRAIGQSRARGGEGRGGAGSTRLAPGTSGFRRCLQSSVAREGTARAAASGLRDERRVSDAQAGVWGHPGSTVFPLPEPALAPSLGLWSLGTGDPWLPRAEFPPPASLAQPGPQAHC